MNLSTLVLAYLAQNPWIPEIPREPDPLGEISLQEGSRGVVPLPVDVDRRLRRWFDRYTKLQSPSGLPIHILAQPGWSEDQIVRVRRILEHFLREVPGVRHREWKAKIADSMGQRRATMVLFRTADDLESAFRSGLGELPLGMQDLRANECPVEGDADYMQHRTRDAAYEEILHLVHDYGIRPVLRDYDENLHRANLNAKSKRLWKGWPEDEPENHRNEYFAAIYDNYLDLWAVKPKLYEGEVLPPDAIPDGCSHFGMYRANNRKRLAEVDPQGFKLIEKFLPAYLSYVAELPASLDEDFYMHRVEGKAYTHKSQHLTRVHLRGDHSIAVYGNSWDNEMVGNAGDNSFAGGAGQDRIDGGGGRDFAIYRGIYEDYAVLAADNHWIIRDKQENRDGQDILRNIEVLEFRDRSLVLEK